MSDKFIEKTFEPNVVEAYLHVEKHSLYVIVIIFDELIGEFIH